MKIQKITSNMLKNNPDQVSYILGLIIDELYNSEKKYVKNTAALGTNDFNKLINRPMYDNNYMTSLTNILPQVNSDWNASSGVAQILNKPSIPAAQVNSDWNAISGVAQILNKPDVPVITLTNVDPGEGASLEANHFIGVYQ